MAAAARRLTLEQRIFVIENWLSSAKNSDVVKTKFQESFPETIPPSRQTMSELAKIS